MTSGGLSAIAIAISFLALAFNALTYRDRRRQERRDLFLKLHERLLELDLQRGRRLLFDHGKTKEQITALRRERPEEYDLINRAIGMLEVAAMYVERKYVSKDDFLAEWGFVYGRVWEASGPFLDVRFGGVRGGDRGWPRFRKLGPEAAETLGPSTARPDEDLPA